jgi:hypothetical protein
MSVPPPMSTSISNIPIQQQPDTPKVEEDPEVAALLQEMNQVPTANVKEQYVVPQQPINNMYMQPPTSVYQNMYYTNSMPDIPSSNKPYFHYETAQKTLYFVVIAFIVFYPNIFDSIYEKFPKLDSLKAYDIIVRSFLLFAIIYALLWKFNL